jgi:hypothetical protein
MSLRHYGFTQRMRAYKMSELLSQDEIDSLVAQLFAEMEQANTESTKE